MAAEQGCKPLIAADITAGNVTITPAVQPVNGSAHADRVQTLHHKKVVSSPRVVTVVAATLVIDLEGSDRVGDLLCWTSYDT